MGTDPVIGELQQVSKVCVVEGLLSSFKLVPECHTHPENQIRSSMIGFIGMKDSGRVKADLMLLAGVCGYVRMYKHACIHMFGVQAYTHA